MLSGTTQKGRVKTWFDEKGFGFISLSTGNDCYFHRTTCVNQQGYPVETSVTANIEWDIPKGRYRAVSVTSTDPLTAVPGAALGATAPGVSGLGAAAATVNPLAATAAGAGSSGAAVNGFLSAMSGMGVDALTLIQQTAQQLASQQLASQQLAAQQLVAQQAQQLAFGNALANAAFDAGTAAKNSQISHASDSNVIGNVSSTAPAGGLENSMGQSGAVVEAASPAPNLAALMTGTTSNELAASLPGGDKMVVPGMMSGTRQTGSVKTWFEERGFGFLRLDAGNDCYFHRTVCDNQQGFPQGTRVAAQIEWEIDKGRYKAASVTMADPGAALSAPASISPSATPGANLGSLNHTLLASLGLAQSAAPSAPPRAMSPAALLAGLVQQKGSGKGPAGEHRFMPYGGL